jgi:hypothetical protein
MQAVLLLLEQQLSFSPTGSIDSTSMASGFSSRSSPSFVSQGHYLDTPGIKFQFDQTLESFGLQNFHWYTAIRNGVLQHVSQI